MRAALGRGPQPDDIENVLPVIVPRTFFALGNWPGPHANLRRETLGLTWAVLSQGQTMAYVNDERAALWTSEGVDWRARSLANLAERSPTNLGTHRQTNDKGEIVFVAMMQPDGLGSSRALLRRALELNIQAKYRVGLPDRSCCLLPRLPRKPLETSRRRKWSRICMTGCVASLSRPAGAGRARDHRGHRPMNVASPYWLGTPVIAGLAQRR